MIFFSEEFFFYFMVICFFLLLFCYLIFPIFRVIYIYRYNQQIQVNLKDVFLKVGGYLIGLISY